MELPDKDRWRFYQWEVASVLCASAIFVIFWDEFSWYDYSLLMTGLFWCWAFSSDALWHKVRSGRYRFSFLRLLASYEKYVRAHLGQVGPLLLLGALLGLLGGAWGRMPIILAGGLFFECARAARRAVSRA